MDILKVKQALNAWGGSIKLDPTNKNFGNTTISVVKAFQSAHGLEPDGKVGPLTLAALMPLPSQIDMRNSRVLKPFVGVESNVLSVRAMQIAVSQNGIREMTGKNDGVAVETFLRAIGLGKGYSWCMAFVYWCYQEAANQLGLLNPLVKTGGVIDQWNRCQLKHTKEPLEGDIFILDYGKGMGHTGIVTDKGDGVFFNTIEGNTNNNGSSNGDGVYTHTRKSNTVLKGFLTLKK